jgi:hypothetical protein
VSAFRDDSLRFEMSRRRGREGKPILEQESGELAPYWNNPAVSRKDKLDILEKVVLSSDARMKPILTADQWDKLQTMRTAQKQELKDLKKAAKAN